MLTSDYQEILFHLSNDKVNLKSVDAFDRFL
jgi:hypothetical protein